MIECLEPIEDLTGHYPIWDRISSHAVGSVDREGGSLC